METRDTPTEDTTPNSSHGANLTQDGRTVPAPSKEHTQTDTHTHTLTYTHTHSLEGQQETCIPAGWNKRCTKNTHIKKIVLCTERRSAQTVNSDVLQTILNLVHMITSPVWG